MKNIVLMALLVSLVSGCSLFDAFTEQEDLNNQTLQNLKPANIRLMNNESIDITHDEVMEKYRAYLDISTDAELRVRTHHRIANLRLQKDEFIWEGGDESDEAKARIAEVDFGRESIADYETLLAQYPDRNDNDLALYQLAKAYSLAGEPFETIRVLEQLTELFPRSDYYLESLFRLGEVYYSNGVYGLAENAYQRLIERGAEENKFYLSAMYLVGWSQFKQNNYDDSLNSFTSVLDLEFPTEDSVLAASNSQQDMLNDILRIMAITFDYLGDWENISQFYAGVGGRHYEYLIYDTLANQYYDKKYYKSGASTLRAFIKRYPQDVLAPVFYQRVIAGYTKARYPTLLRKHKKIFVKTFGVGNKYWENHNVAVQDTIRPALSTYIWDLARFNHAWGQRIKNKKEKKERLQEAIGWYSEYIRSFPLAEDTAKAHFLLAEVAYQMKQYPLAKDHYEIVAYQYPEYEKASESGYAAILTYSKHRPKKADKAIWRQLTVASAMRFVQEFPNDDRRGRVLVNTSEMLLTDKYYEQALATANLAWQSEGNLTARHRYGASLVRSHSSFHLEQFVEAELAITEALSYKKIKQSARNDLREKLAASVYKQGEMAQAAGDNKGAVKNWLRIAKLVPESDIKVSAEFDAATLLMASEQYDQAVPVLLDFRKTYPNHRLVKDIPSKLIVAYESQKNWRDAAFELQKIWQQGGDKDQQRIALFQSAEYFEKADDVGNALAMYKRYAHDYKRPFNPAIEAHHKLDEIYLANGDDTKRLFWMNKIVWLHLGAKKDKTDRSKYLAAKASYELAENERIKFDKVKITLPLAKSINKKNKRMKAALERYTQAVQIGVLEFTTSATFRIAELYSQFSQGLIASERPPGLDELALEEYGYLLEDQAFPLEEAAIEVHQTNAGRTFDGLYDQWVKKSYGSLADLMPAQYAKYEKQVSYVDAIR
ncbi:MAG: tetratricopeptide repeat protein [Oleispira sp.]